MNNSGSACGTMEKAWIRRFYRGSGPEGHYGLPGMRERGKLIGGKLVIWSEVGCRNRSGAPRSREPPPTPQLPNVPGSHELLARKVKASI